ncbi:MAG: hypothetical protein MUP81_00700 [Dehalococcoidia bacterium]|nr:hypothetical protein [Dehalococcoidia bacterium]
MNNSVLLNYQQSLCTKFPSARIDLFPIDKQVCLSVRFEKGDEWAERVISFTPDITQEQMDDATDDLLEWEKDLRDAVI